LCERSGAGRATRYTGQITTIIVHVAMTADSGRGAIRFGCAISCEDADGLSAAFGAYQSLSGRDTRMFATLSLSLRIFGVSPDFFFSTLPLLPSYASTLSFFIVCLVMGFKATCVHRMCCAINLCVIAARRLVRSSEELKSRRRAFRRDGKSLLILSADPLWPPDRAATVQCIAHSQFHPHECPFVLPSPCARRISILADFVCRPENSISRSHHRRGGKSLPPCRPRPRAALLFASFGTEPSAVLRRDCRCRSCQSP